MEKKEIIDNIHTLVSHNVIGDRQALSRYKGFRGELFYEDYMTNKHPQYMLLEGGIIISKDSQTSSLDNSIYITIVDEKDFTRDYSTIFSKLSKLGFKKMFLITYNIKLWKNQDVMIFKNDRVSLPVPILNIFEFDITNQTFLSPVEEITMITSFFNNVPERGKNTYPIDNTTKGWLQNNLSPFNEEQLTKIYMNRLILDGYIGFGKEKGKPSDIDNILKINDRYILIEVKEKDLPKQAKKGFGLDIPRLEDLLRIKETTNLQYNLVVRHIDNQIDRNLVGWKTIKIEKFYKEVKNTEEIKGGTGMRGQGTYNPTLICPLESFRDF